MNKQQRAFYKAVLRLNAWKVAEGHLSEKTLRADARRGARSLKECEALSLAPVRSGLFPNGAHASRKFREARKAGRPVKEWLENGSYRYVV